MKSRHPGLSLLPLLLLPLLAACLGDGTLYDAADCDAKGPQLIETHCLGCHAASREGEDRAGAPHGVNFDTDDDVLRHMDAIRRLTFERESMPPGRPFSPCEKDALDAHLEALAGKD